MSSQTRLKIFGPAAFLIGCAIIVAGVKEYEEVGKLKSEGVVVPAQVVDGRVKAGRRGSKTYYLTVNYQAQDGRPFSKELTVSQSTFDAAEATQKVAVRYAPSDPKLAEVDGDGRSGYMALLAGAGVTLAGVVMTYRGYRKTPPAAQMPLAGQGNIAATPPPDAM